MKFLKSDLSLKKLALATFIIFTPVFASADVSNLQGLISQIQTLVNALIPLLFGFALIGFIWGVVKYIWAGGRPEKIKEARGFIIFSIVGIAVMLSVWSLALFLKDSFFPTAPATYSTGSVNSGGSSSGSTGDFGNVTPGSGAGSGSNFGSNTDRTNGAVCYANGGCNSGYCNLSLHTCENSPTGSGNSGTNFSNGSTCYANTGCSSGYCDMGTNMCANPPAQGTDF